MTTYIFQFLSFILMGTTMACNVVKSSPEIVVPDAPTVAESPASAVKGEQTAVCAGGCFWGVDAVFKHVKGVTGVKSGYTGGTKETANYETVSTGTTGHAESVFVTYDPTKVTYPQLLSVFFSVAHDPTELNFQGPDHGAQYRSAIFYMNDEQKNAALAYIDTLGKSKTISKPVVTEVVPFKAFYDAEKYHQDYLKNHPTDSYIVVNDAPKVADLKVKFPDLYAER